MSNAAAVHLRPDHVRGDRVRPNAGIKTRHVYAAILAITLVADWFNRDFILTRAVQEALYSGVLTPEQFEERWFMMERAAGWSVLLTPILLLVYIGFWSLALQLGLVLCGVERRFGSMFRVATIAQLVVTARLLADLWYRWRLPESAIDADAFFRSLGLLSELVPGVALLPGPLVAALGLVTVFELAWYVVVFAGLTRIAKTPRRSALAVVTGLFLLFNTLQWSVVAYLEKAFA